MIFFSKFLCRQNSTNKNQGKIGLAVLKDSETKDSRIILYKSKTNILSTTSLDKNQKFYIKNDYLQFQDDAFDFWSLLFESREKREQIVNEIHDKCSIEMENDNMEKGCESKSIIHQNSIEIGEKEQISVKNAIIQEEKPETDVQVDETSQSKANIVSRIAKMGRAIPIPKFNSSTATEVSDSSDNDTQNVLPSIKPPIQARKAHHHSRPISTSTLNCDSTNIVPYNASIQMIKSNPSLIMIPNNESPSFNAFYAENRIQNSEMRINLMKIDSKLDQVLDRCDLIKMQRVNGGDQEEEIINLEEKILELKKENRILRLKTTQKNENIISTHYQQQQHVQELEAEVEKLKINYNEETAKCNSLRKMLQEIEMKFNEKTSLLNESENNCNNIQIALKHSNDEVTKIQEQNEKLEDEIKLKNDETEILQTKLQACSAVQKPTPDQIDDVVKEIFNNLFRTIIGQINEAEESIDPVILKIIGRTLRYEKKNACDLVKSLIE